MQITKMIADMVEQEILKKNESDMKLAPKSKNVTTVSRITDFLRAL